MIDLDILQKKIEEVFDIEDLFNKTRKENYIVARSVFFTVAKRKRTYLHLQDAYNVDHSTIHNSISKFDSYYTYYINYKYMIEEVLDFVKDPVSINTKIAKKLDEILELISECRKNFDPNKSPDDYKLHKLIVLANTINKSESCLEAFNEALGE